ncbi:thioesterase [Paraburkholderia ginsengiterrae]|uniref:Thioesterase n=1 Tax=Paraburkholderia ginsengiterrae TaxID=1462993 RepID=A0A1A9NF40_9BURK|nr:thioesterase family protein [Paraburkholderia ginsengiterrae]OAJ63756.1 thioesterase [Paraburkholderia ginsengiterrae]OAJ65117.1 thioesterase [Paraburkholderia ginsengiterrae]
MFEQELFAGWGDMDFNSHMKNTAYLDKSADVRMLYFAEQGFSMTEFMRLRIGPVVMKDEIEYFREFHLLDRMTVRLTMAGLSNDGSRMVIRNEFFRGETLAARVTSTVGWLDLTNRKLTSPPEPLLRALDKIDKIEDFVVLPGSVR